MIRSLRSFLAARRGAIAVEFALVSPVFAVLLIGAWDMGRYLNDNAALSSVTRAGLQYAVSKYWDEDLVKAAAEARAELEGLKNYDIDVSSTCDCPDGTVPDSCTSTNACGGTNALRVYTEVTATETYETTLNYILAPEVFTMQRSSKLRVR
jgi:Flp pilus assembly protein TadG